MIRFGVCWAASYSGGKIGEAIMPEGRLKARGYRTMIIVAVIITLLIAAFAILVPHSAGLP